MVLPKLCRCLAHFFTWRCVSATPTPQAARRVLSSGPTMNVTIMILDGTPRKMMFVPDGDLSAAARAFVNDEGIASWGKPWIVGGCSSESSGGIKCLEALLVEAASAVIDEWLVSTDGKHYLTSSNLNLALHYNRGYYNSLHFTIGQGSYGWIPEGTSPAIGEGLRVYCGSMISHLIVGRYVSISSVEVYLGCEHRTEWTTTYPLAAFRPEVRRLSCILRVAKHCTHHALAPY